MEGYNGAYTGQEIDKGIANANSALQNPEGGTTGQVLTKTENGVEWSDAPSGGGGVAVEPFIITDDWVGVCYQNCYRIGNVAHIEISNGDPAKKINIGSITFPDSIKVDQGRPGAYICVGYVANNQIAAIVGMFHPMNGDRIDLYFSDQMPLVGIGVFQINFSFPIQE